MYSRITDKGRDSRQWAYMARSQQDQALGIFSVSEMHDPCSICDDRQTRVRAKQGSK